MHDTSEWRTVVNALVRMQIYTTVNMVEYSYSLYHHHKDIKCISEWIELHSYLVLTDRRGNIGPIMLIVCSY